MDMFGSKDDVMTSIKSALLSFSITKNQIKVIEKDEDDFNILRMETKNKRKWKISVEEDNG